MTKIRVKNISDRDLAVPNMGVVASGETIEVDEEFNNSNFEVVSETASRRQSRSGENKTDSEKEEV